MTNQENVAPEQNSRTVVVGIGASAGGVKALTDLFAALPADTGAAFVVILHLNPTARSELATILSNRGAMHFTQVTSTVPLKPNCVYVIAPDRQLVITDDEVSAIPFEEPRGRRAPIDSFLRSLASQHGDGFAVILTGGGSDGAVGIRAVKETGGIVLVQDPDAAEHPSMPRAAIATEAVDFILPIKDLAARLADLIRIKRKTASVVRAGHSDEQLRRVLAHLRARTGHDFSHYKRSTVSRRVTRRLQVSRRETLEEYYTFLRDTPEEAQALLADLLVSVTSFFRDPRAFEALAQTVIAPLFRKEEQKSIRVWVAGCATGEEAYSIAMLLLEEASRHDMRPEIQVFGSDLDTKALASARDGRYPAAIEADVSEDRLRRFFTRDGEYYRVKRELRDTVLFANHSLLKDPPFSKIDVISCRNLLIYLDRDLQQEVLGTIHYALNPGGFLFLGSSESAEHNDTLFRPLDRDARISQAVGRPTDRLPSLPRAGGMPSEPVPPVSAPPPLSARSAEASHRGALESSAPPSILVDQHSRVVHLSENAGRYLQPSAGPLTHEIGDLVRPELRLELRAALHRAFGDNEPTLSTAVSVRFNGHASPVYLQVRPVVDGDSKRALIFFLEGEERSAGTSDEITSGDREIVGRLTQELETAESRLRATREDYEAANEELRAANEELQSINEEYRSTAEELETSKEELQSINEELQTVNSELKLKLETVSRANSDMQNLMGAMDYGTLFLDSGLKIRRFTPRLTELFNITPSDVGRTITDFTHQLEYEGLTADAALVLENLSPIEREVCSRQGGWYLVRFRPYRTIDDKIDGVVVTFLDVTERHKMEIALRDSESLLLLRTRAVELSRAPVFSWELNGAITQWNKGSEELYGYTWQEALGKNRNELLRITVEGPSLEDVENQLRHSGSWKGEVRQIAKDGRSLTVETRLELAEETVNPIVLESIRDVTQEKLWAQRQAILIRELTHRVKNALAVTQGMIQQTWRTTRSPEEFIAKLEARIGALSDAHMLLVETDWADVDLRRLVEKQVAPFIKRNLDSVSADGPEVSLPSEIATGLGLVLHELATNAVKYGALSSEKGKIQVSWTVDESAIDRKLRLIWQEQDGPTVKKPQQKGFGSRLIASGIPNAVVRQEFDPSGLQCVVEIPVGRPAHQTA